MLSEEKINANYLAYIKRLERYGCYSEPMMNELGEKLKNAPYSKTDSYGGCYKGGLIDVTLNILCKIGYSLNDRVFGKNGGDRFEFPSMCVNTEKLMKVLLLCNISKAMMFEDETDNWKIQKGMMYKFVDNPTAMKSGLRAAYICQKYGITLDEEEFEAIIADETENDINENVKGPLYTMVQTAKTLTNVTLRQDWKKKNKPSNTIEK